LLLFTAACGNEEETKAGPKPQIEAPKSVHVSRVQWLPLRRTVEYVGTLTAHRKADVASETSGTVERLYFEKGDRVVAGELLAEINTKTIRLEVERAEAAKEVARSQLQKLETGSRPEEIRIAEAVLREAQAALREAEQNYNRMNDLYNIRAVSRSELDAATRTVDMSRARVEAAQQQLALAREGPRSEDVMAARAQLRQAEAALALARDRLRKSMLRAPCDGVMASREVEEGEVLVVPPAKIIARVVDLSRLKIQVSVAERDIRAFETRQEFEFSVDAIPREIFYCRLWFLSPTADPATRSFPAEFMVEKPDERMADGMTARIPLPLLHKEKILKVPSAWLSEEDGEIGLYVAEDKRARFRKVTLGAYYDERVEILSGVSDADLIITNPPGLKSGDPVAY
jgi:multidrug efflux pump subunit AcrA (membrane-fusion protein)